MSGADFASLPEAVRALARADVAPFARRFDDAGFVVDIPVEGVLTVTAAGPDPARPSVLLSVGVHGDETGPLEMVAHALDALAHAPGELGVDLMVCVGNSAAIRAEKRFVDADLNRMFRANRGDLEGTAEAARADALMAATAAFFEAAGPARWHLDLHTAIRASRYPRFAIVPEPIEAKARATLVGWLGAAGIQAVINNPASGGTYSWWTSEQHGAAGATVELGRVGTLGSNDLAQFAAARAALDGLLRGRVDTSGPRPLVFATAQTLSKRSDAFCLTVGRDTENFTPLARGAVIATDGDTTYTVGHDEECIVFPNPDVRVGLRAGIMVVRLD